MPAAGAAGASAVRETAGARSPAGATPAGREQDAPAIKATTQIMYALNVCSTDWMFGNSVGDIVFLHLDSVDDLRTRTAREAQTWSRSAARNAAAGPGGQHGSRQPRPPREEAGAGRGRFDENGSELAPAASGGEADHRSGGTPEREARAKAPFRI